MSIYKLKQTSSFCLNETDYFGIHFISHFQLNGFWCGLSLDHSVFCSSSDFIFKHMLNEQNMANS